MDIINYRWQGLIIEETLSNTKPTPPWDPQGMQRHHYQVKVSKFLFKGRGKWQHITVDYWTCPLSTEMKLPFNAAEFMECWAGDVRDGGLDFETYFSDLGYLEGQEKEARRAWRMCKSWHKTLVEKWGIDAEALYQEACNTRD